jgi:hypothetical protein
VWFFWTFGKKEGVVDSFLEKIDPEVLLDKDLRIHQVDLSP